MEEISSGKRPQIFQQEGNQFWSRAECFKVQCWQFERDVSKEGRNTIQKPNWKGSSFMILMFGETNCLLNLVISNSPTVLEVSFKCEI